MFTPIGMQIHYVKIVHTKFFIIKNQGVFEVEPQKGVRYGKTVVYFFDTRSAKPLDPRVCKELDNFAYSNKLTKIKRKDVRHGAELRKLVKSNSINEAMTQLKEIFKKKQDKIDARIDEVTRSLEGENLPEGQQGLVLVESLIRANMIEKSDADLLSDQIESGDISFVELVEKLRGLEKIDIQIPITMDAQKFLEDYHTYNPADLDTLLDASERYADKIRKMGSPEVKNFVSAAVIFAVLIGGAIAVMILAGTDFSNFLPFLAKEEVVPVVAEVIPVPEVPLEGTVEEDTGVIIEEEEDTGVIIEEIAPTTSGTPKLWVQADP